MALSIIGLGHFLRLKGGITLHALQTITVIGAGTMGAQIAMVAALAGLNVRIQDLHEDSLKKANNTLHTLMNKQITKGKISLHFVVNAFDRLTFTTSLQEAVTDTDFVIEAVIENISVKRELFAQLDKLAPAHAILATNSSMIISSKLADVTNRPDKVCNLHFFNPVLVMELVEVVQGPHTSGETAEIAMELAKQLNKTPILLKKEIDGFVANRILGKVMDEAIYLLENGIASIEEIDLACTKALNHPIGPFALMDLTGIDTTYFIRQTQYEVSGDERLKPPKVITEKFENGDFGRKTGKGFYSYQ